MFSGSGSKDGLLTYANVTDVSKLGETVAQDDFLPGTSGCTST